MSQWHFIMVGVKGNAMNMGIKDVLKRAQGLMERNRLKPAERLLEGAVELCRRTVGQEHLNTAEALDALGLCRMRQDLADAAEKCFRQAIAIMCRLAERGDCRLSVFLIHAALVCRQQDKTEESQELLKEAADVQKCLLAPDHLLVTFLLNGVNVIAAVEGQNTVGRALVMAEYMYGRGYHSAVAAHALAQSYSAQEQWSEAKALTLYELEMLNEIFGPTHQYLADALGGYGHLAEKCGETAAAICSYNQELLILMTTTPDDVGRKEELLRKLADLYRETGDLPQCASMLQAVADMVPRQTVQDLKMTRLTQYQAIVLYEQHKYAEALPLAQKAARWFKKLSADAGTQGEALYLLALIYLDHGEDGHRRSLLKARALFGKAIKKYSRSQEGRSERMAEFMEFAARASSSLGRDREVERLLRAALRIRQRTSSRAGPEVSHDLNDLAVAIMDRYGYSQARPLLKRALRLAKKRQEAKHTALIAPLNNLAVVEAVHHRYMVAARLNQQAISIIETHHADMARDLVLSLQNQGTLLALAGRTVEAAANYQKALSICEAKGFPEKNPAHEIQTDLACLQAGRFEKSAFELWHIGSDCFQDEPTNPVPVPRSGAEESCLSQQNQEPKDGRHE